MSRNSRTLRISAILLSFGLMIGFVWFKSSAMSQDNKNGSISTGNAGYIVRSDSDSTHKNLISIPIYSERDWFLMSSSKVAMMVEPATFSYLTNDTTDHRTEVILPDSIFEKLKGDSVHIVPGIVLPPKEETPDEMMIIPSTKSSEPLFRPENLNSNQDDE